MVHDDLPKHLPVWLSFKLLAWFSLLLAITLLLLACSAGNEAEQALSRYLGAKRTIIAQVPEFFSRRPSGSRSETSASRDDASAIKRQDLDARAEAIVQAAGFEDLLDYMEIDMQVTLATLQRSVASLSSEQLLGADAERKKKIEAQLKDPMLSKARRAELQQCLTRNCKELDGMLKNFKSSIARWDDLLVQKSSPELKLAIERRMPEIQALSEQTSAIRRASRDPASQRR